MDFFPGRRPGFNWPHAILSTLLYSPRHEKHRVLAISAGIWDLVKPKKTCRTLESNLSWSSSSPPSRSRRPKWDTGHEPTSIRRSVCVWYRVLEGNGSSWECLLFGFECRNAVLMFLVALAAQRTSQIRFFRSKLIHWWNWFCKHSLEGRNESFGREAPRAQSS